MSIELIKGMPDWNVPINANFAELEADKTNILNDMGTINTRLSEITYLVSSFKQIGDIDDTASINRALAFVNTLGGGKVRIPFRLTQYVISSTLIIYGNTTLEVDNSATIFLANNSNCIMLANANKTTQSNLTIIDENIKVIGGIWNGNNHNQSLKWNADDTQVNVGMFFGGVNTLKFKPSKILNTKVYGCLFANIKNLLIEDVEIDVGDLMLTENQDGIHLLGLCENVTIQNCIIHSWDNAIALNADDVSHGTYTILGDIKNVFINNIVIKNDVAQGTLAGGQGILLLSGAHSVKNITIENISGKATYLIAITPYDFGVGNYDNITIQNITLEWIDSQYRYIQLNGIMGTINLKNIKTSGYCSIENSRAICAYATVLTPCTIDRLNIEDVNIGGLDGYNGNHYLVYIDNQVYVKTLSINKLISKNNAKPSIPLYLFQSRVDSLLLSNFDIDHAINGVLSTLDATLIKVRCRDVILDTTSVNEISYINNTVTNLSELRINNCGNINVLGLNKIDNLIIDNQVQRMFTPSIIGATSSGSATYSEDVGKYIQTGKLVNFEIAVTWTGHSGTGQLFIPLPLAVTSNNISYIPVTTVSSGIVIASGGQLVAVINKETSALQVYIENTGDLSAFNVPTSGTLYIVGAYISV